MKEKEIGCDNCYYSFFDEKAYPCSLCIRGIERTDQWQPNKYEELKRGKWVWGNEKKTWHKCSVCGESAYSYYNELADNVEELFDYCPYCGADMRAE